mmetsp:Transcript_82570/g.230878  ORF Transcript_82570/g.230878 Transcript_82570/m.230878 type:complete len:290 (-) Transcript_82570:460-1329(-)
MDRNSHLDTAKVWAYSLSCSFSCAEAKPSGPSAEPAWATDSLVGRRSAGTLRTAPLSTTLISLSSFNKDLVRILGFKGPERLITWSMSSWVCEALALLAVSHHSPPKSSSWGTLMSELTMLTPLPRLAFECFSCFSISNATSRFFRSLSWPITSSLFSATALPAVSHRASWRRRRSAKLRAPGRCSSKNTLFASWSSSSWRPSCSMVSNRSVTATTTSPRCSSKRRPRTAPPAIEHPLAVWRPQTLSKPSRVWWYCRPSQPPKAFRAMSRQHMAGRVMMGGPGSSPRGA